MQPIKVSKGMSVLRRVAGYWRFVVCGLVLTVLGVTVDLRALLDTLRNASVAGVALSVGVMALLVAISAINVWLLLRISTAVRLVDFGRVYFASWGIGLLLPGQLGDASQVVLLRRLGVPMSASSAAYAVDKTVSMAWLVSIGMVGVLLYFPTEVFIGAAACGVVLTLLGAVLWQVARRQPARDAGHVARIRKAGIALKNQLGLIRRRPRIVAVNFSITIAKWGVTTAWYLVAFSAVHEPISVGHAAVIPIMASLVGYIPISVGGLGTSELTAVAVFEMAGIGAPAVLSVWAINRTTQYTMAALALALHRGRNETVVDGSVSANARECVPSPHLVAETRSSATEIEA